jgi:hydroxymethylbilane synthase
VLDVREFVPAPGQGAIAVTMRTGDEDARAFLTPVLDAATGVALMAERAFLRVLDGSCKTPIGGYACLDAGNVAFHAIVLKPDGSRFFEIESSGPLAGAESLGEAAGHDLAAQIPAGFFEP